MELFHRDFGGEGNPPLVLLHGLLGSSRNWVTVARLLSADFHVFGLDLRNHGKSPHADAMNYPVLAADVLEWLDAHELDEVHMVGHSMGGKTAMWLGCNHPHRIASLTIADIAPKPYSPHFRIAFDGMHHVDPTQYNRISEVEQALSEKIDDPILRQFLVTNLVRNQKGTFNWQVNLNGLTAGLSELSSNPLTVDMHYKGSSLLLHGAKSDFVDSSDWEKVLHHFPQCKIVEVPDAGHNVHVENRSFFASQVVALLRN